MWWSWWNTRVHSNLPWCILSGYHCICNWNWMLGWSSCSVFKDIHSSMGCSNYTLYRYLHIPIYWIETDLHASKECFKIFKWKYMFSCYLRKRKNDTRLWHSHTFSWLNFELFQRSSSQCNATSFETFESATANVFIWLPIRRNTMEYDEAMNGEN